MSEPQFKVGDRCFSHYTYKWGTVEKVGHTDRDRFHHGTGKPEDRMDDTTWYTVRNDDGTDDLLDDAHGNWDMARLVPPHIAKRYNYGDDPNPPKCDNCGGPDGYPSDHAVGCPNNSANTERR